MIDWDDIQYFLAVARAGNVTSAASKLAVNHSTVSRRIQAMEKKHGVRLFERVPTGYIMTEAAENILPIAEDIERKNRQIERLLFAEDQRPRGKLTLTIPNDLANHLVIPKLPYFLKEHPLIDLQLSATPDLVDLTARHADIAIRLTPTPPDHLVGKKTASLVHGLYAAKSYQRRKKEHPSVILWQHEKQLPSWVKRHFPNAEVSLRVDDLASMYAAVKSGLGIARMPCYLPDHLKHKTVCRYPLEISPSSWGVWLLSHVDLRETTRVNLCKSFLADLLAKEKELFEGAKSVYF